MLTKLAEHADGSTVDLDGGSAASPVEARVINDDDTAPGAADLIELRDALARERELVERLRRSRLELERRAAEAEEALSEVGRPSAGRLFGFGRGK